MTGAPNAVPKHRSVNTGEQRTVQLYECGGTASASTATNANGIMPKVGDLPIGVAD